MEVLLSFELARPALSLLFVAAPQVLCSWDSHPTILTWEMRTMTPS